ncbi:hypothetical protein, partial [Novacetimonas maltaceti]|uniref:hypothetical protein n=1 Tax=Novacetimonas maltaceti TaxID=1203393 RepID=UPI001CA5729A
VAGGSEGVGTKGVAALPFALPLAGRTKGWGFEGADARVIFGGKPPFSVWKTAFFSCLSLIISCI